MVFTSQPKSVFACQPCSLLYLSAGGVVVVIFVDITKVLSGKTPGLTRGPLRTTGKVRLAYGPTLDHFSPLFGECKGTMFFAADNDIT